MITSRSLSAALLMLLLLAAAGAGAQTAPDHPPALPAVPGAMTEKRPVRITTAIDKVVIRVGDLIHYSMSIEAPEGSQIAMPPPGAQLGAFLIRDYQAPGIEGEKERGWWEKLGDGLRRAAGWGKKRGPASQEFSFTITTYMTGDLVIPPLPLMVIDPNGNQHPLFAESARVRVVPVTSPEDLTIKDIKPPVGIAVPPRLYLPWAAAPLAVIAAVAAALFFLSRRTEPEVEAIDLRPAHEIAREELLALEREGLLAAGDYERLYTRVSWIVRKYLSLRFGMYALEYTTTEISERLRSKDIKRAAYDLARRLLEEADVVKFARHQPALDDRNSVIARARDLVESTTPEPAGQDSLEAA